MTTHTPTGPPTGPVNNHLDPATSVLVARWFADPTISEERILSHGLRTPGAFAATMSRPVKSPELMEALAEVAVSKAYMDCYRSQTVLDVLAEPNLPLASLLRIAAVVHQLGFNTAALLAALCTNPGSTDDVIIRALWGAGRPLIEKVATATGLLLPLVIERVSSGYVGVHNPVPDYAVDQIAAVHTRWARWAGQDPARTSFLLTSALRFTDEDEMFAAGDALTGQPTRMRP